MSDDIVTKLEFLLKEGAAIIKEQADEIERLRKLMKDFVSLHIQTDQVWVGSPNEYPHEIMKAYYAKFHEMKEEVRGE